MNRYIDADALIEHLQERYDVLYKEYGRYDHYTNGYGEATELIEEFPTADVVEVRHGRWIKQKSDGEAMKEFHDMGLGKGMSVNSIYWTCSVCENWGTPYHKYCSSCGAKMDGERKEK